jgi:hypothetical protein
MIDDDSRRRLFDVENQAEAANARARAAGEARDRLREHSRRLENEVSIACAIASELFATLVGSAPEAAHRALESILSHYDKYQGNQDFPNLRELLSKLARSA